MRRKRFISILLLTVYLLAVGGTAWASLSCDCVTMHARTIHTHACCHHCHHHVQHAHDLPDVDTSLSAPCCEDRHSTEIELYTASTDDEHTCKCVVIALPHCLAAAQTARLAAPKFRKQALAPPVVRVAADPLIRTAGLRAPPVSA